jgi:hypothetical protein
MRLTSPTERALLLSNKDLNCKSKVVLSAFFNQYAV